MRRARDKVVALDPASDRVAGWRAGGQRVVFANGVFDLLHVGHLRYLLEAKQRGDRLVVAVNGDRETARIKGPGRPVLPASERATLVAALRCVDLVVVFEEPTVDTLLERLRPDAHAKGTDYRVESVPERATAAAHGVETVITGDPKRHSTREIVDRLRSRRRAGG